MGGRPVCFRGWWCVFLGLFDFKRWWWWWSVVIIFESIRLRCPFVRLLVLLALAAFCAPPSASQCIAGSGRTPPLTPLPLRDQASSLLLLLLLGQEARGCAMTGDDQKATTLAAIRRFGSGGETGGVRSLLLFA